MKEPTTKQLDAQEKAVTVQEASARQGPGRDLQTSGERSPCWNKFPGRICDPVEDPQWNRLFLKECTPWKSDTHYSSL